MSDYFDSLVEEDLAPAVNKDAIIERQQARIKDYQNSCEQKQEIIEGMQDQLMSQQAEIERLTAVCIQAKRFITCYHWKDNPPSSGNWDVSGAGEVYEQLKEVLTPES